MYARSYEKIKHEEEGARILPSGYSGIAFESEAIDPPPTDTHCQQSEACACPIPREEPCEGERTPSAIFSRIPFLQSVKLPFVESLSLNSLFSDTEDFLLLGLFFLLLFSKEGDTLCAMAILILFFTGKD